MTWLLDGNLLVALQVDSHIHHDRAHRWFAGLSENFFATCAVTQGTLLRLHMRLAADPSSEAAWEALRSIVGHPRHQWWGDDLNYLQVPHRHLHGSAQVTDAWLAQHARNHGGKLATLDTGLAQHHNDVAVLLPE